MRAISRNHAARGRQRSGPGLWCVLALLLATTTLAAQDGIRIVPLVREGNVLVTFALADAFTENIKAAIQSGLRTTFTYTIELRLEVPVWVDRTIDSVVINNIVQYDNLTRRHSLVRTLDGRVAEERVTEDEALVRQFVTAIERMPLFRTSKLEPNREYYVRVQAVARPRNDAVFWPWGAGLAGQAKFTFIP